MISKETICEELEKQLLANGMNGNEVLLDCSVTPCSACFFNIREQHVSCWELQKELAQIVKRKVNYPRLKAGACRDLISTIGSLTKSLPIRLFLPSIGKRNEIGCLLNFWAILHAAFTSASNTTPSTA